MNLHSILINCRSLLPKISELKLLCETYKPSLIFCNETWLHRDIPIYFQRDLSTQKVDLFGCFNNAEVMCIVYFNVIYVLCYFPPWLKIQDVRSVYDVIVSNIDYIQIKYNLTHVCILGDFNRFESHSLCNSLNLINIVTDYTRQDAILDCVFISNELVNNFNTTIRPPLGKSDHNTVFIHTKMAINRSTTKYHQLYDFRNSNLQRFNNAINKTNWSCMYELPTVDEKTLFFERALFSAMQEIPKVNINSSSKDKIWITPLCKSLVNKRWQAFRDKDYEKFKHFKKKTQCEIKKAKALWYEKCKSQRGGVWNLVKNTAPKNSINIETLRNDDENVSTFCNRINECFLESHIPYVSRNLENFESNIQPLQINFSPVQVFKGIENLKRHKATGSDNIPNVLLKSCAHIIYEPILHLYTTILNSAVFPSSWKCSYVIPLPKTSPARIDKLRPISLLPNISKLFEKLLLSHIETYFYTFIDSNQHGFMPKHSTTTCLIHIHDLATKLLDMSRTTAVTIISFDLSKAFDLVPHDLLIHKLSRFLPSNILHLLVSYLSNREQKVRINGVCSSVKKIPAGVPQGSILSPLLFNVFFNDLTFSYDTPVFKYADDATLVITHNNHDISSDIDSKINEMLKWCSVNCLKLNTDKTQIMCIKKSTSVIRHPLHSSHIKILGVIFDENLKWNRQINSLIRKASQRIYILRHLKTHLSKHQLLVIYKAMVESILSYASSLYINLPHTLESILTRIVKRCHYVICHPFCRCDIIEKPAILRQKQSLQLFNKALCDPSHPISSLLPERLNITKKLRQPLSITERRKHSFVPTMVHIVNSTKCNKTSSFHNS